MATPETRVEYEGILINHRITWMLSFQDLLFTALSFATNAKDTMILHLDCSPPKP